MNKPNNDIQAVKGLTQLPGAPIYYLPNGTPVYIGSKPRHTIIGIGA